MVNERLKGSQSFWAPYLEMLPRPLTICEWSSEELEELQDSHVVERSHRRADNLRATFNNVKVAIEDKFLVCSDTCIPSVTSLCWIFDIFGSEMSQLGPLFFS